jgi:zinc protease
VGWDYDERYPDLIRRVTVEEVQSLARELFANTLVVRTLPESPGEILPPQAPQRHSFAR